MTPKGIECLYLPGSSLVLRISQSHYHPPTVTTDLRSITTDLFCLFESVV